MIRENGDHLKSAKNQDPTSQGNATRTDEQDLDNQIRLTKKLYREFKSVLADYLLDTRPDVRTRLNLRLGE